MATIYTPQSIDTSRIDLPTDLLAQTKQLAKNNHYVWATKRISECWKYGEKRRDEEQITPCLVPYKALPKMEKLDEEVQDEDNKPVRNMIGIYKTYY